MIKPDSRKVLPVVGSLSPAHMTAPTAELGAFKLIEAPVSPMDATAVTLTLAEELREIAPAVALIETVPAPAEMLTPAGL